VLDWDWHGVNEDIPCEGENDDGYEGGDGQGDALEDPVDGHHDDAVGRPHRLLYAGVCCEG
jgi:hypothetical protein